MSKTGGSSGAGSDPAAQPIPPTPPIPPEDAAAAGSRPPDGVANGTATSDPAAARIAELEDLHLRALADLDNLRKRCAAQISQAEAETKAAVAREWLPVIDNLDRALAHSTADPAAIIDGVRAVRDQALGVLARLGFPRRDDRGAMFDPTRHEAIASRVDPAAADGSVAEVVTPAYGEGDHQLRPAQVVVARPD